MIGGVTAVIILALVIVIQQRRASTSAQKAPSVRKPVQEDQAEIASLRHNLRLKMFYDEEKIDRAIEFERARLPNGTLKQWMEIAIARWERENR